MKCLIQRASCVMGMLLVAGSISACNSSETLVKNDISSDMVDAGSVAESLEPVAEELLETKQEESTVPSQEEQVTYRLAKEIFTGRHYTTETEYDEQENPVKETTYVEGVALDIVEREYDLNAKLLKETSTYLLGDAPTVTVWDYDAAGNQIVMYELDNAENKLIKASWEYDAAGNMTKEIAYGEEGVAGTEEHAYDAAGNRVKTTYYDKSNSKTSEFVWEYDANGNRISESSYRDGELDNYMEWEYDENGNMLKAVTHNDDGSFYIVEMKYDEAGNMIEMSTDYEGDGNIDNLVRNEIVYDEAGNMIQDTRYDSDDEVTYTYTYEYIQVTN